jgi:transposase-like protein
MTDGFLRRVLEQYEEYETRDDKSPLKELAKDYGVNPSTVSRWIAKARDLPKGR